MSIPFYFYKALSGRYYFLEKRMYFENNEKNRSPLHFMYQVDKNFNIIRDEFPAIPIVSTNTRKFLRYHDRPDF